MPNQILKQRAHEWLSAGDRRLLTPVEQLSMFAESIVREAAEIATRHGVIGVRIADAILHHFGVKEG